MSRIKMVYDWFSPVNPIVNNKPNPDIIFDIIANDYKDITFPSYGHKPGPSLIVSEQFESIPLFALKDNDVFIYNITNPESGGVGNTFDKSTSISFFQNNRDVLSDTSITESVLNRIRNGNGYLMFELIGESYITDNYIEQLHNYFKKYKIPFNKVIYYTGCSNAKALYKVYCDRNSIRYRMNIIQSDWFEYTSAVQIKDNKHFYDKDFSKIEKTFLCYNNRWRLHRAHLFALFYKFDLLKDSYYSMADESGTNFRTWAEYWYFPGNYKAGGHQLYTKHNITRDDIEYLNKLLPLTIDKISTESEKTMLILPETTDLHHKSLISIVTETRYSTADIFFTEKTWKPIANKQPFIMVGPYQSLYYLKQKGYKTFDEFFDESYDLIQDPYERLFSIVELCRDINSWTIEKKKEFYIRTKEIVEYNFNLLKDGKLNTDIQLGHK